MTDQALLWVHFGSSYPEARERTHQVFLEESASRYPDWAVSQAYSSGMIRRKLKARDGLDLPSPEAALENLAAQGVRRVIVLPTYIMGGAEYGRLVQTAAAFQPRFDRLDLGRPLLDDEASYGRLIDWMKATYPNPAADSALLWMGHGTADPQFSAYAALDHMLAGTPFYVGCVESYPPLERMLSELQSAGVRRVRLRPLMIVAGDHAQQDMAGDGPKSWKSTLQAAGFQVSVELRGLGEELAIRRFFYRQADRFMAPSTNNDA